MRNETNNLKQPSNHEKENIYIVQPLSIQEKSKLLHDKIIMQLEEQGSLIKAINKETSNQLIRR